MSALLLFLAILAEPNEETARKPVVILEDESWTHIGDGRFSPQSNGSSDLTSKTAGPAVEFEVMLTKAARESIVREVWRSAVLSGSVIGNDTGQHGNTTPTVVHLNGKPIGTIEKSGLFRIVFDKSLLVDKPGKPNVFRIVAGKNSGDDLDEQELGVFRLVLSESALPSEESRRPATDQPGDG